MIDWFSRLTLLLCLLAAGCQTPETKVNEKDESAEERAFSNVRFGKKFDLSKSVIIDVRSRFDHEMARPPRSFHAYWKDWSLKNYRGHALEQKKKELQRQLSLKGIDPLTRVVIVGKGLEGQGEEFLLATTLISLGIKKLSIVGPSQLKTAMVSRNVPPLENLPYWEHSIVTLFDCKEKGKGDISVDSPRSFFNGNLSMKSVALPKTLRPRVSAKKGLWAYGVALHLFEQGRNVCVLP